MTAPWRVGLGAMGLTGTYGHVDPADALRFLRQALDAGVRHIDTAASYGDGRNERLIGAAIAGRRADVTVATKCGVLWRGGRLERAGSPEAIRAGVDASLSRLGLDAVDLLYLHRVDPKVPIEQSVAELEALRREGRTRAIGVSDVTVDQFRRAAAVAPIDAVQVEYSLLTRAPERDLLPALRAAGADLVAYAPLGRGLLGGEMAGESEPAADDFRSRIPRFRGPHLGRNLARARALHDIASRRGATAAQVALAWLLRGEGVRAIPGTTRLAALRENLAAAELELEPDDLSLLEAAFPPGAGSGDAVPDRR